MKMRMTPDSEESIRCTASGCSCVCFKPGIVQLRSCDRCGHGWVAHALEKLHLQAHHPSSCGPVEVALPGLVFDLSSLVLYGAQAIPVRLKILLDRLYSILTPEQVGHILHTLGWSLGDYVRGYMLQFPSGTVLDRWLMVTPEEELLVLKQFLRFGETRPIVELMTLQCLAAVSRLSDPEPNPAPKSRQSNTGSFIERNGGTPGVLRGDPVAGVFRLQKHSPVDRSNKVRHAENSPSGQSLLLPFHFPSSAFHCLVPPTKEFVPSSKMTQCLRSPSGTKPSDRQRQDGGRRGQEIDPTLQRSKGEAGLKIKADPDKPNPALSMIRHLNPRFDDQDQELDLHRSVSRQENTSSLMPSSSSLPASISSSPPKISQRSSYTLSPLPSFSSSFLCPPPTSSFSSSLHSLPSSSSSSSLHPLPSSLCSLPSLSPAGGRKGRVCCGVCGKSFYDKGTLKIHYNAVHLKIKHRCTVAGCTMVFSSLRSRNRHSANPNPRLHTGTGRDAHRTAHADPHTVIHPETQIHKDKNVRKTIQNTRVCRDKEISSTLWQQDDDEHTQECLRHTLKNGLNVRTNLQHDSQDNTPPRADSPPPSVHLRPRSLRQDTNQNFTLSDSPCRSDLQTPPAPPPPLLPAHSASSLGSPPSLVSLVAPAHTNLDAAAPLPVHDQPVSGNLSVREGQRREACTNQQRRWESRDPTPKKKPRKSSMPVKIEREKVEGNEEEC